MQKVKCEVCGTHNETSECFKCKYQALKTGAEIFIRFHGDLLEYCETTCEPNINEPSVNQMISSTLSSNAPFGEN